MGNQEGLWDYKADWTSDYCRVFLVDLEQLFVRFHSQNRTDRLDFSWKIAIQILDFLLLTLEIYQKNLALTPPGMRTSASEIV